MWVAKAVTEIQQRVEQAIAASRYLPHAHSHSTATSVTPPWWTPKALPLYITGAPRQKKMAQMKEQIKAPEKIQPSNEEIASLSDAQFKILVIRKLTEVVEFGCKLDEKMKAILRETKENVQGTNSDGKETGTQINSVDKKEERNIQREKNEETRIQKMRRGLGTSRTS